MKGTILDLGVIRAEDDKRYVFEVEDIKNLNSNISDFSGLEVDFEPLENTATSIFIISKTNTTVAQNNSQALPWFNLVKDVAMNFINKNESSNNTQGRYVELETNSEYYELYVGNAVVTSEFSFAKNITKVTQGFLIGDVKGSLLSIAKPTRIIRMADKTFIMNLNTVRSDSLSTFASLSNSFADIDAGDFIVLLAELKIPKKERRIDEKRWFKHMATSWFNARNNSNQKSIKKHLFC